MNTRALFTVVVLALPLGAAAQEARPETPVAPAQVRAAPAEAGARAAAPGAARVRSSHTVDVIAPGESVETVLDRMRGHGPEGGPRGGPGGDRPEVRGAGVRGPEGGGPGGPGGRGGKDGRGRPGDGRGGGPGGRDGRGDGGPPHRR